MKNNILKKIDTYLQCFPRPSRDCEYVPIVDENTGDFDVYPCSSAFPALVLAIKDMKYTGKNDNSA